jgi:2-polyprenyl-3-methyl-5-hydroxy-6-metoxy-1,4-benzoquinol methylase
MKLFRRPLKGTQKPFLLDQYKMICEKIAQDLKVSPEVHPEDLLFQYCINHPEFKSEELAVNYYFSDGANSTKMLSILLTEICGYGQDQIRLLEFASGFGCITRHLKQTIPFCDVTACDIHPEAIRFIRDQLAVDAVLSSNQPDDLSMDHRYDVVFALSFFSHMPNRSFNSWLRRLSTLVDRGGFLIFTTHGLVSKQKYFNTCKFDKSGFYFDSISEQQDLDGTEYGTAVVKPQYVFERLFQIPDLTLKYFQEAYWWGHQDVYIAQLPK